VINLFWAAWFPIRIRDLITFEPLSEDYYKRDEIVGSIEIPISGVIMYMNSAGMRD
jgi:hypothetical protein